MLQWWIARQALAASTSLSGYVLMLPRRRLATAPLRWVGLVTRQPALKVPLFQNYRDKQQAPFMAFQLAIKASHPHSRAVPLI